jgi:membrane-bound lytic murein transglycosylase D
MATSDTYWRRRVASHPLPRQAAAQAPRLQAIFEAERLPACLVWVAEVESGFNPDARSPAGAVGLYQLMPATARSLGLTTVDPDQRLDPESNARAAARYLRHLYRRFGDWPLVLAAYNGGEGRVAGALRRHGATRFDAIAPHLSLETRMYVPRVLETIRLRAGIAPDAIPPPLPPERQPRRRS